MVGNCFYTLGIQIFEDSDGVLMGDDRTFSSAYSQAYLSACGELLEPLGWPGATDGNCELPDPTVVARDLYGVGAN